MVCKLQSNKVHRISSNAFAQTCECGNGYLSDDTTKQKEKKTHSMSASIIFLQVQSKQCCQKHSNQDSENSFHNRLFMTV